MHYLISVVKLMRVQQWVKNLFMFVPIFFAGKFFVQEKLLPVILGFGAFSLAASAVYILNDIKDQEEDRNHPKKKYRPIASGAVSVKSAYGWLILFLVASLSLAYWLNMTFFIILSSYLALNVAYSSGLKKVSILDLVIVATGFVLRVLSGGELAVVPISQWLIIMVFLLSLFIVLAKRRDDLLEAVQTGSPVRTSSKRYNLEYVLSVLTMLSGIIIVSYIMYCLSDETLSHFNTDKLYLTAIFVIMGVLRYLQIALVENNSGYPTRILLTDRFIQLTMVAWVISFFFIIYYA